MPPSVETASKPEPQGDDFGERCDDDVEYDARNCEHHTAVSN